MRTIFVRNKLSEAFKKVQLLPMLTPEVAAQGEVGTLQVNSPNGEVARPLRQACPVKARQR